jgi:bifunctional non-homologous end joining protein LigD
MLHFAPIDPAGQLASMPVVHSCEHTGWPIMSNVLVQGLVMHSDEVSDTVVHEAPNVPAAGPLLASGVGVEELEQAPMTRDNASNSRCIPPTVQRKRGPRDDRGYAGRVEYAFGDVTIACSNVDRVMFPTDGITKGELITYYRDVADQMVPELSGRPLSVVRYTKGIDRGGFFQKHYQKHFPAWLDRVAAGTKTVVEYPIVDDAAGLVYMANQGSIEFHVWTSRKDALDRPDLLVFDLDPPDAAAEAQFALVRRAAVLLRAALERLGLPAFAKLTGSRGLHVVSPLDDAAGFDEVGALATRLGAALCRAHPDLLTMEFYKKDRRGRLFVDVMRNAISATLVAPYSLRGRPGAPVSAPIAWSELDDPALRADSIRLRDLRRWLDRRGDPWRALHDRPGSVASALRALDALGPECFG